MSPRKLQLTPPPRVATALNRMCVEFGRAVFDERTRRRWRLADLGSEAGLSPSEVFRVESGKCASLEAYVRIGMALGMEPYLSLNQRRATYPRDADPVHAAMGEVEARELRPFGHTIQIDVPYQHYQFAGRADLVAIDISSRALLHIENRTRFPDIQAFAGAFNAKRAYLPDQLSNRLGILGGWLSVDHVVVALWSSEVLHTLRLRTQSFLALCPDAPGAFNAWWAGQSPQRGQRSSIVVSDPIPGKRRSRRRWIGLQSVPNVDPRYRGYADALERLRQAHLA